MSRRNSARGPDLLTLGQAAEELGVSRETLHNIVTAGQIPDVIWLSPNGKQNPRLHRSTVDEIRARMVGVGARRS